MGKRNLKVWPWIIPLPIEREEHYKVLLSVFKSKITLEILRNIKLNGKTYQSELIRKLPYSNKTIINKLKELVKCKVLDQGSEKIIVNNRAVWVNWYKPTLLGRWLITFITPVNMMSLKEIKETFDKLFRLYVESITKFCIDFGFDLAEYHDMLEEIYIGRVIENSKNFVNKLDVTVFGSVSTDIIVSFDKMPRNDESLLAKIITITSGGSAANVAIGLSRLGVKSAFIGKIGTDENSRLALMELKNEGVDISSIIVVKGATIPRSIIFIEKGLKKILTIADEKTLSLSTPSEVDWSKIDLSNIIYIGEVYVEVASAIASYAKSKGKTVVYRVLTPYAKMGLNKIENIISNSNHIIMNEVSWKVLQKSSKNQVNSPKDLLKLGVDSIIVTKGRRGAEIYTKQEKRLIPAIKVETVDSTGAGDAFSAGFIWSLIRGESLIDAVKIANIIAGISTTKLGAKNSLPKLSEIKDKIILG